MTDDKALRLALAERQAVGGYLRTPPWRAAVEEVPRHEFLRGGFFEPVPGSAPTAWRPVLPDDPRWLQRCYGDDSLVTQIAGTIIPRDIRGEITRTPTSSRTMPSLVVRMLEELQVEDDQRVLEIGSGYSTGLLCHRLGDDHVTSIEIDEDVLDAARVALGSIGCFPHTVLGDGLAGDPDGAPYDRLMATCGVVDLPYTWVEQTRPGGIILATLCGWLYSSELAHLTVGDDGTAHGRFLGGQISFMLARPQLPPPLGTLPDLDDGNERRARLTPGVLDDWNTRFVAQLAAPAAQRITLTWGGKETDLLLDVEGGSWAALVQDGDTWTVRQGGPARLWDAIEDEVTRWRADGAPPLEQFEVIVTPEGQTVTWPKGREAGRRTRR